MAACLREVFGRTCGLAVVILRLFRDTVVAQRAFLTYVSRSCAHIHPRTHPAADDRGQTHQTTPLPPPDNAPHHHKIFTTTSRNKTNQHKTQEKGVDTVACMAVNDAFVMSRWIKSLDAEDKITMLADGGAVFAEESGLCVKTGKFGGTRLQRLAMIVSLLLVFG